MLQINIPQPLDSLELEVPFYIQGKARPRFSSKSCHAYMPNTYVLNLEALSWKMRTALMTHPRPFFSAKSLYSITLIGFRKRRKPASKKDQGRLELEAPLLTIAGGKPDIDNLLGTIMDAGTSILYADDSQVAEARIVRVWNTAPGVVLQINKLTQ